MNTALYRQQFRAMGSPCEVWLHGAPPKLLRETGQWAEAEALRLERKYSRFRDDSLIGRINARAGSGLGTPLDEESKQLMAYADHCYELSDGLFDVTSGSLRTLWHAGRETIPTSHEITLALTHVGWPKVEWGSGELRLPHRKMAIDLGGIVKEYAADTIIEGCLSRGIRSGLVNLGGDIRCVGEHPKGGPWPISVKHPFEPGALAKLMLNHKAIASSGGYERFIEIEGKRFTHIINPRTGWPIEGLAAVSVVADQAIVAGSLATIGMLLGSEGLDFLNDSGADWIAVDASGKTFMSDDADLVY